MELRVTGWILYVLVLAIAGTFAGAAKSSDTTQLGPFGPEGPRMREQFWVLPSGDAEHLLRATVFRPNDPPATASQEKLPLVVINHGTSSTTRLSVAMPIYYWLSRWFVDRGYAVVLPQRRGHGATGGPLVEGVDSCESPNHARSGDIAADDIEAVVNFMSEQSFVAPHATVVVGISTGGWGALALAARNPPHVSAVINFAGGRGGHAWGKPNEVCGKAKLIEAAAGYGKTARIPSLWLYAQNDSYFGPKLASDMAGAWNTAGADAELHVLSRYGSEGHDIPNDRAGWNLWGDVVDAFLTRHAPPIAHGNPDELAVAGPPHRP